MMSNDDQARVRTYFEVILSPDSVMLQDMTDPIGDLLESHQRQRALIRAFMEHPDTKKRMEEVERTLLPMPSGYSSEE